MRRILTLPAMAMLAASAAAEDTGGFLRGGEARLDARYRFEHVEQEGLPETAAAQTLRLRLTLSSGAVGGFSALVEGDGVLVPGAARYNDTRNGETDHPVVADPEGADLNQAWLQFRGARETALRAGRQRIALDDERFVGAVGWRQNEQTFDAVRLDTQALPRTTLTYAWIDRVQRVFGPDAGIPPAALESDSHLLNAKFAPWPIGALTVYGYFLEFADAPGLSSSTLGVRDEGERALGAPWKLGWTLELARQRDAGANPARIDARYARIELRLKRGAATFAAGLERLGGEPGAFPATENPAFQTPLATLHRWQGWADKFLTTPPAGLDDRYVAAGLQWRGWNGQLAWHDFDAEATGADYGREWDVSLGRRFAGRYDLLVKAADYAADGLFTDTRKIWVQFAASF